MVSSRAATELDAGSSEAPAMPSTVWRALADTHRLEAEKWTGPYRRRRASGTMHPIHDFLFIYYPFAPSLLERWHPKPGQPIEASMKDAQWNPRFYSPQSGGIALDPLKLSDKTKKRLLWQSQLLKAVDQRAPRFACHGLHEWAMLYQGGPAGQARHMGTLPLRVPQSTIDAVVESRPLSCTHFDAYRFFTPAAQPMNLKNLNVMDRAQQEQKGCLHTNMDLYKWAAKAMPWVGSELLLKSFQFARQCREIDMRASPYDCRAYGLAPIAVETAAGRYEYEQAQRALSQKAHPIRQALMQSLTVVCQ